MYARVRVHRRAMLLRTSKHGDDLRTGRATARDEGETNKKTTTSSSPTVDSRTPNGLTATQDRLRRRSHGSTHRPVTPLRATPTSAGRAGADACVCYAPASAQRRPAPARRVREQLRIRYGAREKSAFLPLSPCLPVFSFFREHEICGNDHLIKLTDGDHLNNSWKVKLSLLVFFASLLLFCHFSLRSCLFFVPVGAK